MEGFNKVSFNIWNMSSKVVMHYMVTTLKLGSFVNNSCKKPATDLDEIKQQLAKFMQLEELSDYQNQVRVKNDKEKRKRERKE